MEIKIDGDKVIQTTTINLNNYIAKKQSEIQGLQEQISFLSTRLQNVINELSSLLETNNN